MNETWNERRLLDSLLFDEVFTIFELIDEIFQIVQTSCSKQANTSTRKNTKNEFKLGCKSDFIFTSGFGRLGQNWPTAG